MTKTARRKIGIDEEDLSATLVASAARTDSPANTFVPAPPPPPPPPKPPLFTALADIVDFNNIAPGKYAPASFYRALQGNDIVYLPTDQATANALGYDKTQIFYGEHGNDGIVGGALHDLIDGGLGNDILIGGDGDDGLAGGSGNDQLLGGNGVDILIAGIGIDYLESGAGNDVIVAKDTDDGLTPPGAYANAPVPGGQIYRDVILTGDGDDTIFATNADGVDAGAGKDTVRLNADGDDDGWTIGGDGSDTIIGSTERDFILTGIDQVWWPMDLWNPTNRMLHGGFTDTVNSGDGDDWIITTLYCNANVETGKGNDRVSVYGLMDIISTGDGFDELSLGGGATRADLGADRDIVSVTRAAYDNPNHSEITLGAGNDEIHFNTNEWATNGDKQPMGASPVFADYTLREDVIDHIWVTNLDDPTKSLNADFVRCVDILGGSALIYDDPFGTERDFVFARFNGVTAQELQADIDQNTTFL